MKCQRHSSQTASAICKTNLGGWKFQFGLPASGGDYPAPVHIDLLRGLGHFKLELKETKKRLTRV